MPNYFDPKYTAITAPLGSEKISPIRDSVGSIDKSITLDTIRFWTLYGSNVLQYGAVGDGVTDNTTAIQAGINAVSASGNGVLFFPPGVYGILDTITLKPGVTLKGVAYSPGYFDGYDAYLAAANTGTTCRIKALVNFHSGSGAAPLIQLDISDVTATARGKGYGACDIILDGNGWAQPIIGGQAVSFIERMINFNNTVIMRSWQDGIATANIPMRMDGCHIYGNSRYGANLTMTDSWIANTYIHSNAGGGLAFSDGSQHMTVRGGKIEENFGYGIEVYCGGSNTTQINLVGVDFQHNTKSAVKAYGGGSAAAFCHATGCVFSDNGYAFTLGDGAQLQADANGRLVADSCYFSVINPTPYHLGATNSGKIWHRNSVYVNPGSTAATYTATSGVITADGGLLTSIA